MRMLSSLHNFQTYATSTFLSPAGSELASSSSPERDDLLFNVKQKWRQTPPEEQRADVVTTTGI